MTHQGLGWREDPVDPRDVSYTDRLVALGVGAAPASASMRQHVVEVLDQSITSSCVAHAIAQAIRVQHSAEMPTVPPLLSRLFLYFAARVYHDEQYVDSGTFIRYAFKSLVKLGFCPEREFGFDPGDVNRAPPWNAYRTAADQRAPTNYYRIDSFGSTRELEVKQAIANGTPVVFGMSVGQAFLDWDGGDMYDVTTEDSFLGGHAMCAVEYDDLGVYGPNSWGASYGRDGWFGMTWNVVLDRWRDIWVVRMAPPFK